MSRANVHELRDWAQVEFGGDGWEFTTDRTYFDWVIGALWLPEGVMRMCVIIDDYIVGWNVLWFPRGSDSSDYTTIGFGHIVHSAVTG